MQGGRVGREQMAAVHVTDIWIQSRDFYISRVHFGDSSAPNNLRSDLTSPCH